MDEEVRSIMLHAVRRPGGQPSLTDAERRFIPFVCAEQFPLPDNIRHSNLAASKWPFSERPLKFRHKIAAIFREKNYFENRIFESQSAFGQTLEELPVLGVAFGLIEEASSCWDRFFERSVFLCDSPGGSSRDPLALQPANAKSTQTRLGAQICEPSLAHRMRSR